MTDTDRQRLAAILGMLGSDAAGERDNAARLAEQFRRQHSMTWEELVSGKTVYLDREIEKIVEVPVYVDHIVYRWPLLWRLEHLNIDRGVAIALGLMPIIIFLASFAPHIRHALGY